MSAPAQNYGIVNQTKEEQEYYFDKSLVTNAEMHNTDMLLIHTCGALTPSTYFLSYTVPSFWLDSASLNSHQKDQKWLGQSKLFGGWWFGHYLVLVSSNKKIKLLVKNLHLISSPEVDLQSVSDMSGRAILNFLLKKSSAWTSTVPPSSAEQELHNLKSTLTRIHAIFEEAEEKGISDESEQLRLRELKEVAYDAEDVLDEYEYEALHMEVEARRRETANHMRDKHDKVMFNRNSFHPKVSISDELTSRIKDIRKRFEEINDWNHIGLSLLERGAKRRRLKSWNPTETASNFDEAKTFGREDEKNEIIKWLLQEEEGHLVSVQGIVGMGGLGKTTLAQMVYNDTRVRQHFNLRGWVYVSEDFNVARLAKKIYNCFGTYNESANVMDLNELHTALEVVLYGKKFFLVLDDVWNLKFEFWSSLKTFLVGVGVGKILVTTRDERVAKIMQTTPPIYLSHLSFDDSWLLFKNIACEGRDHDFLEIGKKIVHKCKGLPLPIKVLAGILREEDEEEAWNEVLESELWELDELENDENIFSILKLSYDRLPVELRQCFMYLCLFPKGSYYHKSVIIQQWISHGFIQSEGEKIEEDVGDDYFNELLHRSILQYNGRSRKLCIMHDLIHDLSQSAAKDEYLLTTSLESHHMIPKTIRHVSIHIKGNFDIANLQSLGEAKQLRTLILRIGREIIPIMDLLPSLTCLRTLVLDTLDLEELPEFIGNMKHLRYLDIGYTDSIPASVYNLHYLRTFKFSSSDIELSRDVRDLINLRHINGSSWYHLPREVAGLTHLQTVQCVNVGVASDGGSPCKLRDLKGLPNLKGYLKVRQLGTVAWPDVTPPEAYLKGMRGIKKLKLHWADRALEEMANVDERLAAQVLDSLQPHRDLRSMKINSYPGVLLPTWLGHDLPALQKLKIVGMRRVKCFVQPVEKKSEHCPASASASASTSASVSASACTEDDVESQSSFPSLKKLLLSSMNELELLGPEDCDLPCLHELHIVDCPKLRRLPSLSHLSTLEIDDCPELKRLPSFPMLVDLEVVRQSSFDLLFGYCCCLPKLRCLRIGLHSADSLILPGDGSLDPLEELNIYGCQELRSIEGLGSLPSVQHLEILNCPLLRIPLDEHLPPKLQDVSIFESPGADEWYQNQFFYRRPM